MVKTPVKASESNTASQNQKAELTNRIAELHQRDAEAGQAIAKMQAEIENLKQTLQRNQIERDLLQKQLTETTKREQLTEDWLELKRLIPAYNQAVLDLEAMQQEIRAIVTRCSPGSPIPELAHIVHVLASPGNERSLQVHILSGYRNNPAFQETLKQR